ncbi:hypothetical protein DAA51_38920 [Bradyrhizobium sp. WBAH10]|nr:hypothetical protein DAA51_38920 [Bradyrhizobium sp. WBAH10]
MAACDTLGDYIVEHIGRTVAGARDAKAVPTFLSGDLREALSEGTRPLRPSLGAKMKESARPRGAAQTAWSGRQSILRFVWRETYRAETHCETVRL